MAKKINATVLRKLVLETVREIESEDKVPTRKSQLQSILENAKKSLFEDATPGGVDSERTFVKQIVQKFISDGSDENLFNEQEVSEASV